MYHILFDKNDSYKVAFLIKLTALKKSSLEKYYLEPLLDKGIKSNECIAFSLNQDAKTAKPQRAYLESLLPAVESLSINHLLVNDSGYFKVLTGVKDTTCVYGGVYPCVIKGYEHIKVILGVNYQMFIHDPKQKDKLDLSINALADSLNGVFLAKKPKFKTYNTFSRNDHIEHIKEAFAFLLNQPELAIDVEDVSLNVTETVIGTISFSWSDDTAYVFAVASDYATEGSTINTADNYYQEMIRFLGIFFKNYSGKFIGHNTNYDFKVLIFNTFMRKDFFAYSELIEGIETLCRNFDDTKLIAYLATNSTSRNELGLKTLALPFAGNYGRDDITDITKIPLDELMEYNAIDTISTIWVRNKYYPIMVNDNQLSIYETIFKPSVKDVLHMCLIGVPLDYERVLEVAKIVEEDLTKASKQLLANKYVIELVKWLRYEEFVKCNEKWKKKQEPLEYFDYVKYNPASNNHNQELLYEVMGFDVVDTTEKGNPSTGGDTLIKLKHLTNDPDKIQVLDLLINIAEAAIIYDNFLQKFLHNSVKKPDGYYYLFGDFNLGGTVSGRLSSSNPNLQNIPNTGNKYAKLIKSCIVSPPNYVLCGADFSSLEDRISALTTRDKNKLKVYTDGLDGHCIRAYTYWPEKMPDIDPNSVDSINSIAKHPVYKKYRQDSKAPTFALTYQGTYYTLMQNCGFSEAMAKQVEAKYHELYSESDKWIQDKLEQAAIDGYVTVAFGLRVRTPILAKTVMGTKVTPYEAKAEGRTAGNALGQSYGMLNNRAAIEFRQRLLASPYALNILPIMQIHDAQYHLVKVDLDTLHWYNTNLIECMEWQELPEIQHDQVKLGGEVSVFYPSWADETVIPNNATKEQIKEKLS